MDVTLKDGTCLAITLRTWDGYNWSLDSRGSAGNLAT